MISEETQDQAALYALGLLDADEATAFEHAQAADGELRTLAAELRETTAALARTASGGVQPPPELKARILAQISEKPGDYPAEGKVVAGPWSRRLPWAVAAMLAICCGALAILCWKLTDEGIGKGFRLIDSERRAQTAEAELAQARMKPNVTNSLMQVSYYPLGPVSAVQQTGPQAGVMWDAAQRRGRLRVQKLPSVGTGKDYQLWAVETGHKNPINAGLVKVDADGNAAVDFQPGPGDDAGSQVTAFALSVERAGGVPQNEGPIVFVGKLGP